MGNTEMDRFTFFRSYFDVEQQLETKRDKLSFLEGILFYAFEGTVPPMTSAASLVFTVVKPNLDISKKRSVSGRNDGSFQSGMPEISGKNRDFAKTDRSGIRNRNREKEWNIEYD